MGVTLLGAAVFCAASLSQPPPPATSPDPHNTPPSSSPPAVPPPAAFSSAILEWTPPALAQLSTQAAAKESFTFDRAMLAAAAGMVSGSDAELKEAIAKLDGASVHVLRFGAAGAADPTQVDAIRQAYHLRGWKHLVSATGSGSPVHNGATDVWLVLDGSNIRGAVVLVDSPKSLTLVTLAGNISPVDLLHLRGHFGIPRFEGDRLKDSQTN